MFSGDSRLAPFRRVAFSKHASTLVRGNGVGKAGLSPPMRPSPGETAVLDALRGQGAALGDRAVGWCAVNSGSRNLAGLETTVGILSDVFAALPGGVVQRPLGPSIEIR